MPNLLDDRAPPLIGEAPAFLDTLAHVSAAAPLDRPLLVIGERGAGKELIAARLHFLSARWGEPFVKVNCAALSEDLLESELFGHEAGAFTGAAKRRIGRFERADGGTLFLDEIAAAALPLQEKLLRVIEYGEFERLGGGETLTCDVRVIGATNVDLPARAADGRFRADLLDRLAFDVVTVPPLRARREDILLLAAHFGARMAAELDAPFPGFSEAAAAILLGHDWPGNVRELKNVAERAVYKHIAGDGGEAPIDAPIDAIDLDPFASAFRPKEDLQTRQKNALSASPAPKPPEAPASEAYDFQAHMDEIEKQLLTKALAAHGDNQSRTAKALSLTYDQMRGLIRKHGLATRRRRKASR
ncbi:MAG: phage shock protein operon transcriptional activator [Pseudomonadota bacterium]